MTWHRYSFRAETQIDVILFLKRLSDKDSHFRVEQWTSTQFGEPRVELSTPLGLESVRAYMKEVPDSHVMRDTLRACPLAENTLERA